MHDKELKMPLTVEEADALARRVVAEAGGEVVEEFELTKGTPISVFRVKFDGGKTEGYEVFMGGKPMCTTYDWEAAKIVGSALGFTALTTFGQPKKDGDGKGREW